MRSLPPPLAPAVAALAVLGCLAGAATVPADRAPVVAAASAQATPPADSGATDGSDTAGFTVDVVPDATGRLVPGADLTLTLTLVNPGEAPMRPGTASIFVSADETTGRDALGAWFAGPEEGVEALGDPVARADTPAVVPGGSARLPPITVPAAALPFAADAPFGVHRLSARVQSGDRTAVAVSAVTLDSGSGTPTTPLALAAPIALPPETEGLLDEEDLAAYTAEDGLLTRQLDEVEGRAVAVGIDPRIVLSIRLLGQTAPQSALDWLDRLDALPNETFALAYADGDLAATSQAGAGVPAPTSVAVDPDRFPADEDVEEADDADAADGTGADGPGADDPSPTPSDDPDAGAGRTPPTLEQLLDWDYSLDGIAWPRDGSVVAADLEVFGGAGLTTTIVSSGNAGGAASASATAGTRSLLVSDDTMSALLRDAVGAPTFSAWQSAMARLSAAIAVVADGGAADGTAGRVMLATLDRRAPDDGYQLASTLAVLGSTPWRAPASLGDAAAQPASAATLVDAPVDAARLQGLTTLFGLEGQIAQFSSVAEDPSRVTGERRFALLALASQSWTVPGADWAAAVDSFSRDSQDILGGVQVASTVISQLSDNGALPLVISNELPYPVTITLSARATRPILEIAEPVQSVTVPGDSQKRALIGAESLANGEVQLVVTLTSPTGVPVSVPAFVAVTVNAGWETAVTVVLAVLVVAVFVLGIVRTVRRRRRLTRGGDVDVDDTAASTAAESTAARTAPDPETRA